jgi:alpha-mannosidase
VLQHHDAITSSQRRHVHRDYVKSLSIGQASVDASFARVLGATLAADSAGKPVAPTLVTCPHLNESSCAASMSAASGVTVVVLQNPTAHALSGAPIKVPVTGAATVSTGTGEDVASQLLAAWPQAPILHNVTVVRPNL